MELTPTVWFNRMGLLLLSTGDLWYNPASNGWEYILYSCAFLFPCHPWDWHIYLRERLIFMVNVGREISSSAPSGETWKRLHATKKIMIHWFPLISKLHIWADFDGNHYLTYNLHTQSGRLRVYEHIYVYITYITYITFLTCITYEPRSK